MRSFFTWLLIAQVLAATGSIDSTYKYAWGENIGWVNFGSSEGNITVSDTELTGYAWGENVGWISLNCSNTNSCGTVDFKVSNTTSGQLSGYAWGENVGWINFSPGFGIDPRINSSGEFTGYVWGENIGWINLNCSNLSTCGTVDYKVATSWRPTSGGGGGTGTGTSTSPQSSPTGSIVPTVTPSTSVQPSPTILSTPVPTPTVTAQPTVIITPQQTFQSSQPIPAITVGGNMTPPPSAIQPSSTPSAALPSNPPTTVQPTAVNQVQKISQAVAPAVKKIAAVVKENSQPVSAASTVGIAVSAGASTASLVSSGVNLLNFMQFVFNNILIFFGIKKKTRAWGTIYNSHTKQPLPFTRVQLLGEDMRVLETRITDREGRYGFLSGTVPSDGKGMAFSLLPIRAGFVFPSQIVTGSSDTVLYDRVYNGGVVHVQPNELIKYDLPMDPTEEKEILISKMPAVRLHNFLASASHILFWFALVIVPLNYIINPNLLNLIMLILFVGLNLLVLAGDLQQRAYGVVLYRASGMPAPYSLITLHDSGNVRKGFTVSDELGRYFLLSEKGTYKISTYTPANVSPPHSVEESLTTDRGWIAKKLHL